MAALKQSIFLAIFCTLCVLLAELSGARGEGNVVVVTSDNFNSVLEGEWMLEFYAPWCPACKQFATTWETFADWASDSDVRVGKVDVSAETMLSGQFAVSRLPTVFHLKDGEVRLYLGGRVLKQLIDFIEEEKWRNVDPESWWRSPTSPHMKFIGTTFWLAEKVKEMQVMLQQDYQLPSYAVFIIIALGTIAIGVVLGVVAVFCMEMCARMFGGKPAEPAQRIPRTKRTKEPLATTGKEPAAESEDEKGQGEGEREGAETIEGEREKEEVETIEGEREKEGAETIEGEGEREGAEMIEGAGEREGAEMIEGEGEREGAEMIEGEGEREGAEMMEGEGEREGAETIEGEGEREGAEVIEAQKPQEDSTTRQRKGNKVQSAAEEH